MIRKFGLPFVRLLIACAMVALLVPHVAAQDKMPRVGFLGNQTPRLAQVHREQFVEGLAELGFVDGRTVQIEYRWAEGKFERLPTLARELADLKVNVMLVAGEQGLQAAKVAGNGIPIVTVACDLAESMVVSLARPGGRATGVTCVTNELSAKRVELLREILPKLKRLAVIYNPKDANKRAEMKNLEAVVARLGLTLQAYEAYRVEDFERVFAEMANDKMEAVIAFADSFFLFNNATIVGLALRHRLPGIFPFKEYAASGGLLSYGASLPQMFRVAASHVARILKGADPGELPIQQPTKFQLVINIKTAKALGLTIPQSLLLRANEVIQ